MSGLSRVWLAVFLLPSVAYVQAPVTPSTVFTNATVTDFRTGQTTPGTTTSLSATESLTT